MKKEEFVAQYIEEYLEGKDESYKNSFRDKPIDRQYGTIQTWKRRKLSKVAKDNVSTDEIVDDLKCIAARISNLPEMTLKDENRLLKAIASVTETINGYKEMARQRKLKELQELRLRIDQQISDLQQNNTLE